MAEKRPHEIDELRSRIDALDDALVRLLVRRAGYAVRIGRIKRRLGLPNYSSAREAAILRRVSESVREPLDAAAVRRIFTLVLRESRRLAERNIPNPESSPGRGSSGGSSPRRRKSRLA